jgi:hypothetical protein
MRSRPMSFFDRQFYVQLLAQTRKLKIECDRGEGYASDLRKRCETLCQAIDAWWGARMAARCRELSPIASATTWP